MAYTQTLRAPEHVLMTSSVAGSRRRHDLTGALSNHRRWHASTHSRWAAFAPVTPP